MEDRQQPQHSSTGLIPKKQFIALLRRHLLTHEDLFAMGFPVRSADYNNAVVYLQTPPPTNIFKRPRLSLNVFASEFVPASDLQKRSSSDNRSRKEELGIHRQCVRCGSDFVVTKSEYLTFDKCFYHWGKLHSVNRGVSEEFNWTCCQGERESLGCTSYPLHVWNGSVRGVNGPCEGFVKMSNKVTRARVFALDCEMSFTIAGLEATKVSVVSLEGKLVYESFIKPKNRIIDYNTRFSGITADDLESESAKSLLEVQNDLRKFISASTILIGHGLENDLKALKIIHSKIVDTTFSFPHFYGFPLRRSLKSLAAIYLKRNIQSSSTGHDSCEDAVACIDLMKYKICQENQNYKH